jgi:hypothetical protein
MLARIPFRAVPAAVIVITCLALVTTVPAVSLAAPAIGPYVWPVDGAPVCNASGDQGRLFQSSAACGSLQLAWLHSVADADSLSFGTIGAIPPTGECATFTHRVDATDAIELAAVPVRSLLIFLPSLDCLPTAFAQVWLQGSGAASQIVVHNEQWLQHARAVADDGNFVRHHPRAAPGGGPAMDTALVAVWSDERTGVPQVRAQRVNWSGEREWGASGVLVAPTGTAQTDPEIARLAGGSVLVVWIDARNGGSDVYALRLLPDGSVAPGWPATGLALEARSEISAAPRLVGASAFLGTAYVVWEESGDRFGGGRSIVARRLLADGTPDPAWDPLGVPLTTSATVEHLEDASAEYGDLVVVWTDTRAATDPNPTDVFAQWLEPSGAREPGWPASGLAICTAPGRQDAARVSATITYAAFAWEDHRGVDADVYAELRLSNGTLPPGHWVADGLPATSAPGDQTAPVVGAGNGRGCFVAWEDARNLATSGLDIYAQAFTDEGEKLDAPPPAPPGTALLGVPRPNPTRSTASFLVQLPRAGTLRVDVMDVTGRRVRTLVAGEFAAGARELSFDGRDDSGRELPPGIYRVRARTGAEITSRTLIRIR